MLDAYTALFPVGGLIPEAGLLRAEALVQLGRKDAALAELDRLSDDGMPNREDRRMLRAELRAAVGRWQGALEDFDTILRGDSADHAGKSRGRLERALWGRASVRSRLGDSAGARADLGEYLRRFPQGRFASEAARLLSDRR